jgi:hypothetical protein
LSFVDVKISVRKYLLTSGAGGAILSGGGDSRPTSSDPAPAGILERQRGAHPRIDSVNLLAATDCWGEAVVYPEE